MTGKVACSQVHACAPAHARREGMRGSKRNGRAVESVEGGGRSWEAAHEREQHTPHVCEHLFLGLVRERKKGGARIPKPRARWGGGARGGRKRKCCCCGHCGRACPSDHLIPTVLAFIHRAFGTVPLDVSPASGRMKGITWIGPFTSVCCMQPAALPLLHPLLSSPLGFFAVASVRLGCFFAACHRLCSSASGPALVVRATPLPGCLAPDWQGGKGGALAFFFRNL